MSWWDVLLVGDAHGDLRYWRHHVFPAAKRLGVGRILQLGDFGYWEHEYEGVKYLSQLSREALEAACCIFWIDGNHENHTWLRQIYKLYQRGNPRQTEIRGSIFHMPRGYSWQWSEVKLLALGGAHSIDKENRVVGKSWWHEEMISEKDIGRCKTAGKCDILVSHDCPPGIELVGSHHVTGECPETELNRSRLGAVVAHCKPRLVVHGHWHQRHDTMLGDTRVVGLDCNTNPSESMALLKLPSLEIEFL